MCCGWNKWQLPLANWYISHFIIFFLFLRVFFIFVNMGPYESENYKTLLLLQITAESFQIFLNFLPNGPH